MVSSQPVALECGCWLAPGLRPSTRLPTHLPTYPPTNPPSPATHLPRFAYLQLVPPSECRSLFSPEIAPEMLETTALAIAQMATAESVAWCAQWLAGLAQVGSTYYD